MTLSTRALPWRGAVCRVFIPLLILLCGLMVGSSALRAANNPGRPTEDRVPEGVSAADWQSISAAREAWRHAIKPVKGGWQARNPAQQWTTKFDGRGFEAKPQSGDWTWGLELRSYGAGDEQRELSGKPAVKAEGHRLTYHWDSTVQEWYVNDGRGLEHGFSVQERPPGPADAPLNFVLATRGPLRATVTSDARGVDYRNKSGAIVLTYSGLRVWDAEGRELEARFASAEDGVTLQVDDEDARYPLLIDPIAQRAYLKASNTGAGDIFGYSVAISRNTLVVGAPGEDSNATGVNGDETNNSSENSGAAYVFVRDGSAGAGSAAWFLQAYLKASNTDAGDGFGASVAISGDTVVVGAPGEDSTAAGVNGNQADNGAAVTVIAPGEINVGAAYVFARSGSTWAQQAYLKASNADGALKQMKFHWFPSHGFEMINGQPVPKYTKEAGLFVADGSLFGASVAISGDTVVVGAPGEDGISRGINGDQTQDKRDNWDSALSMRPDLLFGGDQPGCETHGASCTSGTHGSHRESGAAYVFVRDSDSTWNQQAYLKASNADPDDEFGKSVAVSGEKVVVGAPGEDSGATREDGNQHENLNSGNGGYAEFGAAYVFGRNGAEWRQQAYLKGSGVVVSQFGSGVAVSGNTVVVGAPGEVIDPDPVTGTSGAVYVFRSVIGSIWQKEYRLEAPPGPTYEYGGNVAISGDTMVVGVADETTDFSDPMAFSGAAYLYTRRAGKWSQKAHLKASNAGQNDAPQYLGGYAGYALSGSGYIPDVAISGDTVVMGAIGEDSRATGVDGDQADNSAADSGAAYVFSAGDLDEDGLPDEWETDGKGIDANDDGKIDLDLFALGARPDRKDLFVEVDTAGYEPAGWNGAAQWPPFQMVIDAFAKAPVSNPDGTQGITLHIERSDTTAFHELTPIPRARALPRRFPDNFPQNKARLFGSADQREDTNNSTNILAAKAMAFRYCIIYNDLPFEAGPDKAYGGIAELAGDDFAMNITSGNSDGKFDKEELASVFMHELGHTLGLGHGGLYDIQGKPNYPSIMNYALAYPRGWNAAFWRLDFSREGGTGDGGSLPVLDESGLVESAGINSKLYKRFHMPVGVPLDSVSPSATKRTLKLIKLDGAGFDYNGDGAIDQTPVPADLNFIGAGADFGDVDQPTFPEPLEPHNDWANLIYAVNPLNTNSAGFYIDDNCPTLEMADFLDANIEPPAVSKDRQTLVFIQPAAQVFSRGGIFALSASSDSELPVQFISGDTNKIAISNNTATILGAGTVAITATNAGNDIFLPAAQTRTVTVAKASQTIGDFAPIDTQVFMPGKTLAIPLPIASSGIQVSLSVKSGPATVSSNVVTFHGAGIVILAANQGGDDNHLPAPERTISFSVTGASPTPSPSPTPTASPTPSPTPTTSPTPSPTPGALWDEAVDGPLSANPQAPTPLSPAPEANFIYANVGGSAPEDYFTFTVAPGRTLSSVTLTDYVPSESEVGAAAAQTRSLALPTASIALQSGSAWTAGDNATLMLAQQQFGAENLGGESMLLGISPLQPRGPGTYTVRIKQTEGQASYNLILYIDSDPLPAPLVTSPKNVSGRVGVGFTYQITADNGPQSFEVDTLPPGLNLNSQTGVLSGTPTTAGTFFLFLTAISAQGTGSSPLTLRIEPAAAITSGVFKAGSAVGKSFSYRITANNFPSTFQAAGLPAGLKVNATTGVISGRPANAGKFDVTILASNTGTGTASATLALNVAKGTQTITFKPKTTQPFKKGRTFKLSATANSKLRVSFKSSKPKILSITGNKATILRKGEVTITASQGGNANYKAAKSVGRTIKLE